MTPSYENILGAQASCLPNKPAKSVRSRVFIARGERKLMGDSFSSFSSVHSWSGLVRNRLTGGPFGAFIRSMAYLAVADG